MESETLRQQQTRWLAPEYPIPTIGAFFKQRGIAWVLLFSILLFDGFPLILLFFILLSVNSFLSLYHNSRFVLLSFISTWIAFTSYMLIEITSQDSLGGLLQLIALKYTVLYILPCASLPILKIDALFLLLLLLSPKFIGDIRAAFLLVFSFMFLLVSAIQEELIAFLASVLAKIKEVRNSLEIYISEKSMVVTTTTLQSVPSRFNRVSITNFLVRAECVLELDVIKQESLIQTLLIALCRNIRAIPTLPLSAHPRAFCLEECIVMRLTFSGLPEVGADYIKAARTLGNLHILLARASRNCGASLVSMSNGRTAVTMELEIFPDCFQSTKNGMCTYSGYSESQLAVGVRKLLTIAAQLDAALQFMCLSERQALTVKYVMAAGSMEMMCSPGIMNGAQKYRQGYLVRGNVIDRLDTLLTLSKDSSVSSVLVCERTIELLKVGGIMRSPERFSCSSSFGVYRIGNLSRYGAPSLADLECQRGCDFPMLDGSYIDFSSSSALDGNRGIAPLHLPQQFMSTHLSFLAQTPDATTRSRCAFSGSGSVTEILSHFREDAKDDFGISRVILMCEINQSILISFYMILLSTLPVIHPFVLLFTALLSIFFVLDINQSSFNFMFDHVQHDNSLSENTYQVYLLLHIAWWTFAAAISSSQQIPTVIIMPIMLLYGNSLSKKYFTGHFFFSCLPTYTMSGLLIFHEDFTWFECFVLQITYIIAQLITNIERNIIISDTEEIAHQLGSDLDELKLMMPEFAFYAMLRNQSASFHLNAVVSEIQFQLSEPCERDHVQQLMILTFAQNCYDIALSHSFPSVFRMYVLGDRVMFFSGSGVAYPKIKQLSMKLKQFASMCGELSQLFEMIQVVTIYRVLVDIIAAIFKLEMDMPSRASISAGLSSSFVFGISFVIGGSVVDENQNLCSSAPFDSPFRINATTYTRYSFLLAALRRIYKQDDYRDAMNEILHYYRIDPSIMASFTFPYPIRPGRRALQFYPLAVVENMRRTSLYNNRAYDYFDLNTSFWEESISEVIATITEQLTTTDVLTP